MNVSSADRTSVPRTRDGVLGTHLEALATLLQAQDYAKRTIASKIATAAALGRWLENKHCGLIALDEERVEAFLRYRLRCARVRRGDRTTLRVLLDRLRSTGAIPPPVHKPEERLLERTVRSFTEYLARERGLAPLTIADYARRARTLLFERFGCGPVHLSRLRQEDTNRHIQRQASVLAPVSLHGLTAALRSFFTFLYLRGDIETDLACGVPAVACWRLATVPQFLPPQEVQSLLDCCDVTTTRGQRDFTVLLLLSRLGLRAGEIVAMELEDINWDAGEIMVRGKGQLHDRMPLPRDVGKALAMYLRHGRPRCQARRVFVRLNAPHRGFANSSGISTIVHDAVDRAGLHPPSKGAHLLRHSLATNMLHNGASLTEIGEVLRHRCPSTTEIYSKVAIEALRALAQPWPGVEP